MTLALAIASPDTLPRLPVMGVNLVDATAAQVIDTLLTPGHRARLAFMNAHCSNVAASDRAYGDALASADMVLPDGIGIELAARFRGQRLTENLRPS